jgi:hypothetical protein
VNSGADAAHRLRLVDPERDPGRSGRPSRGANRPAGSRIRARVRCGCGCACPSSSSCRAAFRRPSASAARDWKRRRE